MTVDPTNPLEATRRENQALRARVLDLEMQLRRFKPDADTNDRENLATLVEREALLSEAERIAHVGSWVWNVVTDEVFWSDELYRILAYDPTQDPASTEAFFARVHPDDLSTVQAVTARGIQTGIAEQVDFRILLPDSSVRHVTMGAALLFDEAGALRRAIGTVQDVTEARESARKLRHTAAMFEHAQRIGKMGHFEHNVMTAEVVWSKQVYALLDYDLDVTPARELFVERVHPADKEGAELWSREALQGGEVPAKRARVVHRDGSVHHMELSVVGVYSEEDSALQAIRGSIADVTALVELEAQFHQSQKMEAIGQLAGGLAHDFNNLLTVVLGNAEILLLDGPKPELQEILDAASSATSLTQRLLTFSRQTPSKARASDLCAVIGSCRELLKRALGESSQLIVSTTDKPSWVNTDPGQVQQMLLNLALNARDAMSNGGTLCVEVQPGSLSAEEAELVGAAGGPYFVVRVSDTGVGMDEATQLRAFEPFFTTKEPGQGTGLGLAMVFGAMRQAGGFARVQSRLGQGTSFSLWFPVASDAELAESKAPEKHGVRPAEIMVVEDNPAVAKVVRAMLESEGHTVRVASDPALAVELWQRKPADLLVSDVVMPGMSGIALRKRLLQCTPDLRTLFITGYSPEKLELEANAGVVAVVMKPFRKPDLLPVLARLLQGETE